MSRQLYIPTIGSILMLTEEWRFKLFFERRNDAMLRSVFAARGGVPSTDSKWWWPAEAEFVKAKIPVHTPPSLSEDEKEDAPVTYEAGHKRNFVYVELPAGTMLSVFRIYIRRGVSGFDSITFTALKPKAPKKPTKKASPGEVLIYDGLKASYDERAKYVGKFWAKLQDVNEMIVEVLG